MSVFCNLGRTPWVYRAFSYQRLFADAEKGPMQIALGQSDICEFESYMPSHAVVSLGPIECNKMPAGARFIRAHRRPRPRKRDIRVKPDKDRRLRTQCPACEWPNCKAPATHRAPKGAA